MLCRALILSKKISPRAFKETAKKGTEAGEVGIEGTTIQKPDQVPLIRILCGFLFCWQAYVGIIEAIMIGSLV